jgi:hypothetical protein
MTNLFLTREQVENLTYEECQQALAALAKAYDFDANVSPLMTGIWPVLDDVIDTLLYLEDRIKRFEDPRIPSMDPTSDTLAPPEPKPAVIKRAGPKCRQYRVGNKVYQDIHDASAKLGLKVHTLRNYVNRDPEKYGYLD